MASYYAIENLLKEVSTQLSTFVNRCKISIEEDSWFVEQLWIEQPGSKIPIVIDKCAKMPKYEGYRCMLLALVQKLNDISNKSEFSVFDFYLLKVLASMTSIFPPVVDQTDIPIIATRILMHPIFQNIQKSKILLPKFGEIVKSAGLAGNEVCPALLSALPKTISMEIFIPKLKYFISSAESLISFLNFMPELPERVQSESNSVLYKSLYKIFHSFSVNYPNEHKRAIFICNAVPNASVKPFFLSLLRKEKYSYFLWPLAAFLLPFCIKSFESDSKNELKMLYYFLDSITTVKVRKDNFESGVLATIELMFYYHCLEEKTSPLLLDVVRSAEENIFNIFSKNNDNCVQKLMPLVASFEAGLSNGKVYNRVNDCFAEKAAGLHICLLLFNGYPVAQNLSTFPQSAALFLYKEILDCNKEAIAIVAIDHQFEFSRLFSSPDFACKYHFTPPQLEMFIFTLFDSTRLIEYVHKCLKVMTETSGNSAMYKLMRDVFMPYDVWMKMDSVDSQFLIPAIDRLTNEFYTTFLMMYRKSCYNVTQVAEIFLAVVIWIYLLIKRRKDKFWEKAVPIFTEKLFDATIVLETFGFISDVLINKLKKGIIKIAEEKGTEPPTKPSPELQKKLLTLPFTQYEMSPLYGFTIALQYAPVTKEFVSKIFQIIKLNSTVVDAFKSITDEAAPVAETRLRDILEKQILTRDFQDIDYIAAFAKTACNIVKATKKANIVFRREVLANFLRVIACAGSGSKVDKIIKYTTEYCSMIFTSEYPETHVDVGVLRLLIQVISRYLTRRDKRPGVIKTSIVALGSILGSVKISHAFELIEEVKQTKSRYFIETRNLIYASISLLEHAELAAQNESVNQCIVDALCNLLRKNFMNSIDICFQVMSEKTSSIKKSIITAIAKVIDPEKVDRAIGFKPLDNANYRVTANLVDVTFDDLSFDNAISFKACLFFLSYFDIQIKYFQYIMTNKSKTVKYDQQLFLQAFFDFCFTDEDLQTIYNYYIESNVDALIRSISVNRNIVKAYEILGESFLKAFSDNFLRKFLNEPGSYSSSIAKVDNSPIGTFMQNIKTSKTINIILSEAAKSISDCSQSALEFSPVYTKFLEYCSNDSCFDKMHVYGENIINEQIVQMRDSNILIHLGTEKGVEKYVAFLDRFNPQWKNVEIIYHFIEMHFLSSNPVDLLLDCTNSFVSKEMLGLVSKEVKKLHINIKNVYLFNPSDDICDIIEAALSSDLYPLFKVTDLKEINTAFKEAKIPFQHIITQTASNIIFKSGESGLIVVGETCAAVKKQRIFLRQPIFSTRYVLLSDLVDEMDEICLRATTLKNEYNRKHTGKLNVMPFDKKYIFAENLVALCSPSPQSQTEIFSIIQKVARNTKLTCKFDFNSGTFSVPSLLIAQKDVDFFPHFLQKLLELYPEQVHEFYYAIVICLNKLTPNAIPQVAQTLAKYEEFGKSIVCSITNSTVACGIAERLLELNSLEPVIPLIRSDTCSYLINASKTNSLGYSLTLAKALIIVLFKDSKVAKTDELLSFVVISAFTCDRKNFAVFKKLGGIVHLLCLNHPQIAQDITSSLRSGSEFCKMILEDSIEDKKLFADKQNTPFYLYCQSFATGPTDELFNKLMQWAVNEKQAGKSNDMENIEYSMALLERINEKLPQYSKTCFVLALISSKSSKENIRCACIRIMTKCFASSSSFFKEISAFVLTPGVLSSIQIVGQVQGEIIDGFVYIMRVLLQCFLDSTTSKCMQDMLKALSLPKHSSQPCLDSTSLHSLNSNQLNTLNSNGSDSSIQLPFIAFTQEDVQVEYIPATQQVASFLIAAFCDRRAYNQISRMSRALSSIIRRNSQAIDVELSVLASQVISYLSTEVNAEAYKSMSSLLADLLKKQRLPKINAIRQTKTMIITQNISSIIAIGKQATMISPSRSSPRPTYEVTPISFIANAFFSAANVLISMN